MFQSLKLEQKREYASKLEDINSRAEVMMRIFSQGKSWQDYLDEVTRIDALSREDVIEVAKKYFTENYMYVTKKTGRYPKTILPKPDYSPIIELRCFLCLCGTSGKDTRTRIETAFSRF